MKLRRAAAGLLGLCVVVHAQSAGVAAIDDRGVDVRLAAPAQRIVSMLPSLTETVCALGACARLVGVDRYSNFPPEVKPLARLGGLDDANVEAIVALKPDLVLLAQSSRVIERLQTLGLQVAVLEPRSYADVERVAGRVATWLGMPEAGPQLWQRIQAQLVAAAQSVPAAARGLRVYYEVDSSPYAAGASSFIGQTLTRLGAVNVVPAALGPFPKLNPEFVVQADPDLIMVSARNAAGLAERPGWRRIRALREQRVCRLSDPDADVLARAGPRMGDGALVMARCLRDAGARP